MSTESEAARLHAAWHATVEERRRATSDAAQGADQAEQEAYDALIDYVEAHDLNYSKWDPRHD